MEQLEQAAASRSEVEQLAQLGHRVLRLRDRVTDRARVVVDFLHGAAEQRYRQSADARAVK